MAENIHINVVPGKALIPVDIDSHVAKLRLLEKTGILPEVAETVVKDHGYPLGRAKATDAVIGVGGVSLEHIGRDVPVRLVKHLDAVQRRMITIAPGQSIQHLQ